MTDHNKISPNMLGYLAKPETKRIAEPSALFDSPKPGYHLVEISRGDFGEVSKIQEEFEEFVDATNQGIALMQLLELADLLGAIEGWLQKYHPNVTLNDLAKMKDVTKRAFVNGHRK